MKYWLTSLELRYIGPFVLERYAPWQVQSEEIETLHNSTKMDNNKRILDAARDFRIASEMLESRFGEPVFPLRSTIVTTAFSVELYLKYLAACAGLAVKKGHNLQALYFRLPEDLRNHIAAQFQGTRPVSDILQEQRALFVDWRYIYEKQDGSFSIDPRSLRLLANALEQVASKLENEAAQNRTRK